MATTIVTKNSSTAAAVPTAAQLVQGELAVNVADKRLYTEDSVGGIVELGTNPSAELVANGGIALPDNGKATFGASDDLQIYHDGAASVIKELGTGHLLIGGENLYLKNSALSETYIDCVANSGVYLRYDNGVKLATTATGIDVTGTATMDGLVVDGEITGPATNNLTIRSKYSATIDIDSDNNQTDRNFQVIHDGSKLLLKAEESGDISFYEDTGTTAKLFWDASAEYLSVGSTTGTFAPINYIGSNGRLGINNGNTAGGTKIQSFAATNANGYLAFEGWDKEYMRIDSAGNVGIGTDSPGNSLTLNKDDNNFIQIRSSDTGYAGIYFGRQNDSVRGAIIYDNSNESIQFLNNNYNEKMRIDSAGRVGIGTSAPNGKLTVSNGSGAHFEFFPENSTDTNLFMNYDRTSAAYQNLQTRAATHQFLIGDSEKMRIDSAGNLLVGTTSTNFADQGVIITDGQYIGTMTNSHCSTFNRLSSDGDIQRFFKDGTSVGSIGAQGGANLLIGNGDTGIRFAASNNAIHPWNTSTLGLRDAAIDLGADSIRFKDLYLSGGVHLGGTGAANKLDSYEEGDYLAAVTMGSGTLTLNTSFNRLSYTKVGRLVTVTGLLIASAGSGLGGSVRINLPFTCASLTGRAADSAGSLSVVNSASCPSGSFGLRIFEGSSDVYIFDGSGTTTIDAGSSMASNVQLYLSITYVTI